MKIVIISGKGGTGKTSIGACYADMSDDQTVKVDCDVDASNLHLMFENNNKTHYPFIGAKVAHINKDLCIGCQNCVEVCRFKALIKADKPIVNELKCEGCGACRYVCMASAIKLEKEVTGQVIMSQTERGHLSYAEMYAGAEGSGKLVTEVRKQAESLLYKDQLLDGSPGVGCSVIASITDTDVAVVVTEPTFSGLEDMKRVLDLVKHFNVKPYVIVNKFDINVKNTDLIEAVCNEKDIEVIGRIPFDGLVKKAINEGVPVSLYKDSIAGKAIKESYDLLQERIRI
ncbi:(4Fe-4S)-binding protein [Acidaminobacter sp. JC074]|uniref:ATP-binding protein n=1 Tax=Acidaminobacter sp. JC074 TaxID=2530199 RepID=UPI001F10DDFB|nr:ATP-binding protein [Acidaminobacter sp. JC074]MCH4889355.1 (4Fe-4S)-binding protein [Acidaminobacter sp. JC074]